MKKFIIKQIHKLPYNFEISRQHVFLGMFLRYFGFKATRINLTHILYINKD